MNFNKIFWQIWYNTYNDWVYCLKEWNEVKEQLIKRKDIITLLNGMKNKTNENSINQYINRIVSLDDKAFQRELNGNNISKIAVFVKNFLVFCVKMFYNAVYGEKL